MVFLPRPGSLSPSIESSDSECEDIVHVTCSRCLCDNWSDEPCDCKACSHCALETPVELCGVTHVPLILPKFHFFRFSSRLYGVVLTSGPIRKDVDLKTLRAFAITIELIGDRIKINTVSFDRKDQPVFVKFYERECRVSVDVYDGFYQLTINGKPILQRPYYVPHQTCSCGLSPLVCNLASEEECSDVEFQCELEQLLAELSDDDVEVMRLIRSRYYR
ncbi:unnamed protein product [Bursaphelenchus okinawaensis]|uniref:Uncharacterized protein n=1 Tax=Bursaphelenchus okinawaensis TaxID=465554 RepID=A0A811KCU9_9BILA|nr:unnamed protein product [Bursaphelenchus okinawaensis]CAG9102158.1 unnamed protein product [Bursaphelenchus okinawaensis]